MTVSKKIAASLSSSRCSVSSILWLYSVENGSELALVPLQSSSERRTSVDEDLAAGHDASVHLSRLNDDELPLKAFQVAGVAPNAVGRARQRCHDAAANRLHQPHVPVAWLQNTSSEFDLQGK